ncbi:AT4g32400/F8B4_100, related [Neospora caninum Liverpool]|uniref:AT4g32400/F8B4_100, related n=1 Tax=Neospora caninum (strain Liverpool) TaxID=572307 RepID=F0VDK0_NEOCL|nr:AT4g32400/F8B4_100, related [Neospora caninum Liverpool]CBZ51793.1 AT4g32400/F8B4_100, related [Neospora caninum Liverpool]|eukprot:XP_003881826.1 AT4g32400/F8B4_100, related [Neospora caninum Liverpool]
MDFPSSLRPLPSSSPPASSPSPSSPSSPSCPSSPSSPSCPSSSSPSSPSSLSCPSLSCPSSPSSPSSPSCPSSPSSPSSPTSPSPSSCSSSQPSGCSPAAHARRFWLFHPTGVAASICAESPSVSLAWCRDRRGSGDPDRRGDRDNEGQALLLRWFKSDAGLHLTSGAIAGAVSRTVTAPLDRIKVVLQLQRGNHLTRVVQFKQAREEAACEAAARVAAGTQEERARAERRSAPGGPGGGEAGTTQSEDIFERHRRRAAEKGARRCESRNREGVAPAGCIGTVPAPTLTVFDKLLCGGAAGMIAQFTIYPMEIVKTRLAAYSPTCRYDGIVDCLVKTFQQGGLRSLYRGLGPSLLGIIPYASIDLALFDTLKGLYVSRVLLPKLLSEEERAAQEARRQRREATARHEPGPSESPESQALGQSSTLSSSLAASSDARPAARGHGSDLPDSGSPSSHLCSRKPCAVSDPHEAHKKSATPNVLVLLLCGSISSLCGQVVAYPTALVRTRVQVDGSDGAAAKYKNSWQAARCAWADGGVRGLYRGLCANLMKAVPAVSISWLVYEKSKEAIRSGVEAYEVGERSRK